MINEIAIKYLYKNTHRPIDGFPKSVLQNVEDAKYQWVRHS